MRALERGIAALALTIGLVLVAPAAAAPPIKATLTTGTPTPAVDRPWRYTVIVRNASNRPIAARVRLQILLGRTVVGCWKGGRMAQCLDGSLGDWIAFRGKRTGVLTFPAESVGVRLTFRVVIRAGGQTRQLRAPVTVRPGA